MAWQLGHHRMHLKLVAQLGRPVELGKRLFVLTAVAQAYSIELFVVSS